MNIISQDIANVLYVIGAVLLFTFLGLLRYWILTYMGQKRRETDPIDPDMESGEGRHYIPSDNVE
jgi:hypothetical protein